VHRQDADGGERQSEILRIKRGQEHADRHLGRRHRHHERREASKRRTASLSAASAGCSGTAAESVEAISLVLGVKNLIESR
jgi:hypothetical protein